jgi:hypothetical protein
MFKGEILYILSREPDREQTTAVPDGVKIVGRSDDPARDQDFSVIPTGCSVTAQGGRGVGEQLTGRRGRPHGKLRPATGRA